MLDRYISECTASSFTILVLVSKSHPISIEIIARIAYEYLVCIVRWENLCTPTPVLIWINTILISYRFLGSFPYQNKKTTISSNVRSTPPYQFRGSNPRHIHPNLNNITLNNVTPTLTSWKPRKPTCSIYISLLVVTSRSHKSQVLTL